MDWHSPEYSDREGSMIVVNDIYHPSNQIEKIFIKRTRYHQFLIKRNLLLMTGYLNFSKQSLLTIADNHDESKLKEPERTAYIWMNWAFYCKSHNISFHLSDDTKTIVEQGHLHHITTNLHHPESHQNMNHMSHLNIVEMICDWTAISEELSIDNGSSLLWATKEIDKKWQFSDEMKAFIFSTINELDRRKQDNFFQSKMG